MSPATESYQSQYKKLFFKVGDHEFKLHELMGPYGAKLSSILYEIDSRAPIDGSGQLYTRLYRRMKYLEKIRLIELRKGKSGYIPYEKPGFYCMPTGNLFYLFSQVQNSITREKSANKNPGSWADKIFNFPVRASTQRINAVKNLHAIKGRALFQRDLTCPLCKTYGTYQPGQKQAICKSCGYRWKPPLNPNLVRLLRPVRNEFIEWKDAIQGKELIFDTGPQTPFLRLEPKTRFTDEGRKVKNLKTYDRAWDRAGAAYKRGVFVTLTTDPSLHKSLWHANRHASRAFNRYLTVLMNRQRKIKRMTGNREKLHRLRYITAYEFQENGLIHLHICFFGIRYLDNIDQIAKDWIQCGQGRIAHAYGIRNNGGKWEWNREKPGDAAGKDPTEYLRKYLQKALYVDADFQMYWAMNKRFCSMSREFQTKECEGCRSVWGSWLKVCPECGAPLKQIAKGYRYLGFIEKDSSPQAKMMRKHRWPMPETSPGVPA